MLLISGTFKVQIPSLCPNMYRSMFERCFAPKPSDRPTAQELANAIPV